MADTIELGAVERLVGDAASSISMSSTKSAIGHLLGAAGAVEAIFSALAIRDNIAPPTLNLDNPDVETAIDLVPHTARKREINVALSNSFGFGGTTPPSCCAATTPDLIDARIDGLDFRVRLVSSPGTCFLPHCLAKQQFMNACLGFESPRGRG